MYVALIRQPSNSPGTLTLPIAYRFFDEVLVGSELLKLSIHRCSLWKSGKAFTDWAIAPEGQIKDFLNLYLVIHWWLLNNNKKQ